MSTKLSHIIEFVADMDRAVAFYRDVIGLPLKFQSPEWSEFSTGDVTFARIPHRTRTLLARWN
jgi:lactoylglutathione lyase